MSTMKLDLSEWKNLAISHLRLMANQLEQVGLLPRNELSKIDNHWSDVIRPRIDAWATESEISMQEQQRAEAARPSAEPPVFQHTQSPTTEQLEKTFPPKKVGWPPGKKRGPRKPKTEALLDSATVLPPVTQ